MDERPTKRGGRLYWLACRSWWFWIAIGVVLFVPYVANESIINRLALIILPRVMATALAAFCVWLTVRIVNQDQQVIDLAREFGVALGPIVLTVGGIAIVRIVWNFAHR